MKRHLQTRFRRVRWSDSLPEDEWTGKPKVHLYRIEKGRPRYLTTYLLMCFDYPTVAGDYGGGEYMFIAFRGRRILRKGIMAIEGNPIR